MSDYITYMATDLRSRKTYILERRNDRRRRKLLASAMPADRPGADERIRRCHVPISIRRAVRIWEQMP